MTILHVNASGPWRTLKTVAGAARWCFCCRRRATGVYDLRDDNPWYEPLWSYRCDHCGNDGRWFPGCEPDGSGTYGPPSPSTEDRGEADA